MNNKISKKTIIACSSILLVAVLVLVGVFVLKGNKNKENGDLGENELSYMANMTYEEFTSSMKKDLPKEVQDQVKAIYDDMMKAVKEKDAKKVEELYTKVFDLDVMDSNAADGADYAEVGDATAEGGY